MKLIELAKELNVSAEAIKQFIQDFDLELTECISTNFEVKEEQIMRRRTRRMSSLVALWKSKVYPI